MAVDLSKVTKWTLGKCFDHSVLPKNTTEKDIREGCKLARELNCAAFYAASTFWMPIIAEELAGSDVLPACGIDFPWGANNAYLKGH